ncbi:hypothetical protein PC119_g20440 [Phytophthora cactorum]|nr:hypothetical protein PC119_g20440 [Phytophthora cactorum]
MAGMCYTVDSDGDVEMTVPQPNHYKDKIQQRRAVTGEASASVMSTVQGDVKPEILQTMARFLSKGNPVESVTDDEILQPVRQRCQALQNEYIPDIKTLFKRELRMDLSVDHWDVDDFQYFQDFTRIMEEKRLQGLIGTADPSSPEHKNHMKQRCRLLLDNLQPVLLLDQVQQRFFNQSKDSSASSKTKGESAAASKLPAVRLPKASKGKHSKNASTPTAQKAAKPSAPPTEECLVC